MKFLTLAFVINFIIHTTKSLNRDIIKFLSDEGRFYLTKSPKRDHIYKFYLYTLEEH